MDIIYMAYSISSCAFCMSHIHYMYTLYGYYISGIFYLVVCFLYESYTLYVYIIWILYI